MKKHFVIKKEILNDTGVPQQAHTTYQVCYGTPESYDIQKETDIFSEASDVAYRRNKEAQFHDVLDENTELKALVKSMANYLEPYSQNEQHIPTLNTVNDLLRRASKALRN